MTAFVLWICSHCAAYPPEHVRFCGKCPHAVYQPFARPWPPHRRRTQR